jgi:hypothetical protein
LYNIERENPFEGRFLICKVAKRVRVFPSEWEVCKRFFQSVVSFSSVENLFFKLLKVSSFKVKVFGRELFKLLRFSILKFEKVCGRESSLIHSKFEVCARKVFELLKALSFKGVKDFFQKISIF